MTDVDVISDDPLVQRRYEQLLDEGVKPRLAEVFATRSFPSVNGTNKAFNRGRCNGNQFQNCPGLGNYFKQIADSQGVSINGKHYCYGLGRYPGDPRAWVQDTSDVLAVARDRNLNIDGIVNHRGSPVPPQPAVALADDILEREVGKLLAVDPDMKVDDAKTKAFNRLTAADRPKSEPITGCSIADLDEMFGVTEDDL